MMQGVDPRAMADVVDCNGDALDISEDIQLLVSAALVGDITAYLLMLRSRPEQLKLGRGGARCVDE